MPSEDDDQTEYQMDFNHIDESIDEQLNEVDDLRRKLD